MCRILGTCKGEVQVWVLNITKVEESYPELGLLGVQIVLGCQVIDLKILEGQFVLWLNKVL